MSYTNSTKPVVDASSALQDGRTVEATKCDCCGKICTSESDTCSCESMDAESMSAEKLS